MVTGCSMTMPRSYTRALPVSTHVLRVAHQCRTSVRMCRACVDSVHMMATHDTPKHARHPMAAREPRAAVTGRVRRGPGGGDGLGATARELLQVRDGRHEARTRDARAVYRVPRALLAT